MELKDTVTMMQSKDYKERFKAEYHQTRIRWVKLKDTIESYNEGHLPFDLSCDVSLLEEQADAMRDYMNLLEDRAGIEKIDLWNEKKEEKENE